MRLVESGFFNHQAPNSLSQADITGGQVRDQADAMNVLKDTYNVRFMVSIIRFQPADTRINSPCATSLISST